MAADGRPDAVDEHAAPHLGKRLLDHARDLGGVFHAGAFGDEHAHSQQSILAP